MRLAQPPVPPDLISIPDEADYLAVPGVWARYRAKVRPPRWARRIVNRSQGIEATRSRIRPCAKKCCGTENGGGVFSVHQQGFISSLAAMKVYSGTYQLLGSIYHIKTIGGTDDMCPRYAGTYMMEVTVSS
jgi:hypothetical protein